VSDRKPTQTAFHLSGSLSGDRSEISTLRLHHLCFCYYLKWKERQLHSGRVYHEAAALFSYLLEERTF